MAYLVITTVLPSTVDRWLGGVHWLDLRHLGLLPATAIALFVLEVATYWWHRSLHASRVPWRWCHQMHHSAERLDVFGAFVFHPFDLVGFILMAGVLPVWVIGLDPVAVGLANVSIFAAVVLGHANIRTPRWLGYIVQRPENHAVHHQRGLHAFNYADISLIDMIFGTFRNPATWEGQAGFYDGASEQVAQMLLGRDISSAPPVVPDAPPPSERLALGS